MSTFTAIDFETAMPNRNSICQVGMVRVEDGIIVDTFSELVQPPDNEYNFYNIRVHGIHPSDTYDKPYFPEVWIKMLPYIQDQLIVAHNMAFDFSAMTKTLDHYGLPMVNCERSCTYKLYKKKLNLLCDEHDIELQHHDALSDAMACGELYLKWLNEI